MWSRVIIGGIPVIRASPLHDPRGRPDQRLGQTRSRGGRRPTTSATSARMSFSEQVLAAQDIALADPAAFQRQHMALGHVVDMHDVQAGIDVGRHPARRGIQDHLAGRRRLDVARTDRRGGIDHHHRQPLLARQFQHRPLGEDTSIACRCRRNRPRWSGCLVGRRAVADLPERGDRTAMHDALHARRLRRAHHRHGAVDVGPQHRVRIGHPEAVVGGDIARRSGSRRRRGPARRGRSGRRSPPPHPARPGCGGRWWAGPASAARAPAPPARAPPRSRRSRSRP